MSQGYQRGVTTLIDIALYSHPSPPQLGGIQSTRTRCTCVLAALEQRCLVTGGFTGRISVIAWDGRTCSSNGAQMGKKTDRRPQDVDRSIHQTGGSSHLSLGTSQKCPAPVPCARSVSGLASAATIAGPAGVMQWSSPHAAPRRLAYSVEAFRPRPARALPKDKQPKLFSTSRGLRATGSLNQPSVSADEWAHSKPRPKRSMPYQVLCPFLKTQTSAFGKSYSEVERHH